MYYNIIHIMHIAYLYYYYYHNVYQLFDDIYFVYNMLSYQQKKSNISKTVRTGMHLKQVNLHIIFQ